MRSWKLVSAFALAGTAGCGPVDPFPIGPNARWTFAVRGGLSSRVESVRAAEPITVDGRPGWLLTGSLGVLALAWTPEALIAEQLPGTRFSPAIPLLFRSSKRAASWRGMITWMNGVVEARAEIAQERARVDLGGRTFDAIMVRHRFDLPGGASELVSWYAPGFGLVRQQQRDGDRLVRSLEWLAGP